MTALSWDNSGDRLFETGLDRGVLYLPDNTGVVWNGLTGADVQSENNVTSPLYFDGVKTFDLTTPGDFAGTIKAITYPDEFIIFDGYAEFTTGMFFGNQPRETFGLSYRSLIGDDQQGLELGYKIHIMYNLTAIADSTAYSTMSTNVDPIEFSWSIKSRPEVIPDYRPTGHIVIDSRKINPLLLIQLEEMLYGTESTDPTLPTINDLLDFLLLKITNNGDGTWTAEGPDYMFTMLDANTFQIDTDTATYLDDHTYQVSSG